MEWIYASARCSRKHAEFKATYEPVNAPFVPSIGSIEYFLTERYCLYHQQPPGPSIPPRDPPPAVVPPARTRDDNHEHDGRRESPDTGRRALAVALFAAARRDRVGSDAFTAIIGACGTLTSSVSRRLADVMLHHRHGQTGLMDGRHRRRRADRQRFEVGNPGHGGREAGEAQKHPGAEGS